MRVLVTGGMSFTGQAVVGALTTAGYDVVAATSRDSKSAGLPSVAVFDVRDRAQTVAAIGSDFDVVCHLAALTQVRESYRDPLGYFNTNAIGTANVLHALDRQTQVTGASTKLVFASTGAVYGPHQGVLDESQPAQPTNPYGTSKLAAEQLIAHQTATGRLDAVTLRCFNIAGAVGEVTDHDTTRIIPKALAVAAKRFANVQVNGDGRALREYTHVLDVADAFVAAVGAVTANRGHRLYNVGSSQPVSVTEVLNMVREVSGCDVPVEHLPAKAEPQILMGDTGRIRAELGWRPQRSDLRRIVADAWGATSKVGHK